MSLAARLGRLEKIWVEPVSESPFAHYRGRPVDYIREVLKQDLWSKQEETCHLLHQWPYKVFVKSCHKTGKSHLSACLISYFYDCYNPSLTISTAPSKEAVTDQLWRQVRILRGNVGLGGFTGPTACELWSGHDHWAKGLTTAKPESFQGRHQEYMLFVIDEAIGVEPWVFDVIRSMFKQEGKHFLLAIGNPTDTSSQMYVEELATDLEGNPAWHVVSMSALDHPNLSAQLAGEEPPFPAAVSLEQFRSWLADWCEPITQAEVMPGDVEFPPGSGQWYRCGPEMEARGLGRWPSSGTNGVWSDALWNAALRPVSDEELLWEVQHNRIEIGADIARKGDDRTEFHVRCGKVSLDHERYSGIDFDVSAGRLKLLAQKWCDWWNNYQDPNSQPLTPEEIAIKVDDTGTGGGVVTHAGGYNFIAVNAAETALEPEKYPNVRSELWFATAQRAREGRLSLARLDKKTLQRLRQQAMAPVWDPDGQGRRVVEKKEKTKDRLKIGSPDGMDAVNLAYYGAGNIGAPTVLDDGKKRVANPWRKR